jgi:hypothetical protein
MSCLCYTRNLISYFTNLLSLIETVGSENGEISLWEARLRERLISKPFKIWNISNCSVKFQVYIQLFNSLRTFNLVL